MFRKSTNINKLFEHKLPVLRSYTYDVMMNDSPTNIYNKQIINVPKLLNFDVIRQMYLYGKTEEIYAYGVLQFGI